MADDPVLKRFRAALTETYGNRLERVVLFGSRAIASGRKAAVSQKSRPAFFMAQPSIEFAELWRLISGFEYAAEPGGNSGQLVVAGGRKLLCNFNDRLPYRWIIIAAHDAKFLRNH